MRLTSVQGRRGRGLGGSIRGEQHRGGGGWAEVSIGDAGHEEQLPGRLVWPWLRDKEHLCHVPIPSSSGTHCSSTLGRERTTGKHPSTGESHPVFTSTKERAGLLLFTLQ